MSDEHANQLNVLPPDRDQTAAGNYFVANYPPFSLWTPERVGQVMVQLDRNECHESDLGLYVHIPFCRKRCHFCYFRVYTDKNKDEIRQYLDAVIQEAELLSERPYIAGRKLRFIYFGGGTPSYLSDKQLKYLTDGLKRALAWDEVEEVAFECEPGTLTEGKLRSIRDLGVTRLSLGIENFDDEVLKLNNRAHQSKQVYHAYEWARSAGFGQINIDLIAGMLGETPQNWARCVDKTVELGPDAVTIYQMEIPHNTTINRTMIEQGMDSAPVADWSTKRRWVSDAFEMLEAAGYTIGSAYTAVKDPARARFLYRDALWDGADMLGVGVASFGILDRVHYQNQHNIVPYVSALSDRQLPVFRAMTMTGQEQMIRQFILQMKLGRVSRQPYVERYDVDVFDYFGDTLRRFEQEGYLKLGRDELELTRTGLLQVDRLLHAFFLPEHREVRYA